MKQKRNKAYIWITWLTKLIAGEAQCEYAAWFKAHYKHDKVPSDFDLVKWTIQHNTLLHKRRDKLEEEDYLVKIENQNSFKLELSEGTTISGKADIIVLDGSLRAVVEDCKTGQPRNSDIVQVLLYMIFLPKGIKKYENITFDGRVVYEDDLVPISWTDVDDDLKKLVWDIIKRIGSDKPCRKVPSYDECKWCDISKEDCPERVE